jgi:hypothetical protein
MPYPHAPAKNRLTILARANGRDTMITSPAPASLAARAPQ